MKEEQLLASTASIIADYREGEIARPDANHIAKWLSQFDEGVRPALLAEMNHVLQKTYVPKARVVEFLTSLVSNPKLTGGDPKTFWTGAKFLDLQTRGNSQRDFLALFAMPLKEKTGLDLKQTGAQPSCYIYLDDGIFTGMTLIENLTRWLKADAPAKGILHVVVIAGHVGGKHYAETSLKKVANELGKEIEFHWWALLPLEDRKFYTDASDVLRPTQIPEDERTKAYVATLKFAPVLRKPGQVGAQKVFSGEAGRHLLEQQLLIKGAYIREIAPRLPQYARPLGNMVLQTLGFGSTFVTYRNCPNNTPLAFWAGDPWYPLFPRKTN